ncbi:MAG: cell division protein FtsW [Clostridia bacterium]|nr:cell division protein FtsW [Clostridia bacterium]
MLVIILLLICFGSIMVFSASYAYALDEMGDSYYFIKRQILFAIVGLFVMFAVSRVDYRVIRLFTPAYFGVAVLLLLAVLVLGVAEGEAVRWIDLGPFSFQPSEIMKLGLVLMLAFYYSATEKQVRAKGFWKSSLFGTFVPILMVGFVCVLIALEKHISGTIIMFGIGMIVVFVAGGKLLWFALASGGFVAAVTAVITMTDYATKRLDIWLHPENYSAQSEVWQTLQGLYAVGSGGFFGVGLGNSRQKHLFVSQPQNDFIFAIVSEELGLMGAALVIILFVAFIWRCFVIAKRAPDTFSKLAVTGIAAKVGIQAFLNIAVVTNTIPNTGISLPFFSYGGTALIILFLEMGVILSISRYSYLQRK